VPSAAVGTAQLPTSWDGWPRCVSSYRKESNQACVFFKLVSCQHPETNGQSVCFTKVNDQAGEFRNAKSLAIWAGLMWASLNFREC
jgi:hypothetical protein